MDVYSRQNFWEKQRDSLGEIRGTLASGRARSLSPQFQPLGDTHPLLRGYTRVTPRRHRTPPPRLPRLDSPNEDDVSHASHLRGSHYEVVPPLPTPRTDRSTHRGGYDSWGEDESDEEDRAENYHQYPYPVVMYPMMFPPHYKSKSRHKPTGGSKPGKKRVRYRNTPVYLEHQQNTFHEPYQAWVSSQPKPNFNYIQPVSGNSWKDPFDPRSNSVLARYQVPPYNTSDRVVDDETIQRVKQQLDPFRYLNSNPQFAVAYVDDFIHHCLKDEIIPDVLIDTLSKSTPRQLKRSEKKSPRISNKGPMYPRSDPLEEFLDDLVDDLVMEEGILCIREGVNDMVDSYLEHAGQYDILMDMATEEAQRHAHDIAREAIFEVMMEDWLSDEVIEPLIQEGAHEVAMETLKHYNNKARHKEIRQVKHHSGERLLDSLCLDRLLHLMTRQGALWEQTEQANRLIDGALLEILLTQMLDVTQRHNSTVENKPLRRFHEKAVTDVGMDVLLNELVQSLDEDLADLDEYEQGLEFPLDTTMQSELQRWLSGR